MASVLFSIIVPTYRRQRFVQEAIRSVLDQTLSDFECLVIDDGSPDPPPVPSDDRVRMIRRDKNEGPAAARNTGIEAANGEYLVFLDDDDLFTPERLAIAYEGLQRAPVSVCWSAFLGDEVSGQRLLEGNVYDRILDHTSPHLGTVAIVRDKMLTFNEAYLASQDLEWWLRVSKDLPVTTVPRLGYLVRRHPQERIIHGPSTRIAFSRRLLEDYETYFATHRRAAAFRWRRIGLMSMNVGEYSDARMAFIRSLRLRPSIRSLWHLARSLVGGSHDTSG